MTKLALDVSLVIWEQREGLEYCSALSLGSGEWAAEVVGNSTFHRFWEAEATTELSFNDTLRLEVADRRHAIATELSFSDLGKLSVLHRSKALGILMVALHPGRPKTLVMT